MHWARKISPDGLLQDWWCALHIILEIQKSMFFYHHIYGPAVPSYVRQETNGKFDYARTRDPFLNLDTSAATFKYDVHASFA
jgi:hypothetical protein